MANLSGIWLGTYWQQGVPTRFEMTLVQGENSLSGNILDDNYLGEASLAGEVVGRKVTFTKRYLMRSRHTVSYSGTLSSDEKLIQGQWQIDLFNGGNWEAYRSDDNLSLTLENRQEKKTPTLAGES
ncbi:MAG: hypothetical protein ACOC3E_01450 [Cyanobacteriota bacterium]